MMSVLLKGNDLKNNVDMGYQTAMNIQWGDGFFEDAARGKRLLHDIGLKIGTVGWWALFQERKDQWAVGWWGDEVMILQKVVRYHLFGYRWFRIGRRPT